ncbi:MAG: diaminopropionate ammonia-lyase, partial [Polaromonas sp.]|nr:diaminopropionate ammonia-lyase [Polaromonas sp.]
LAEQADQRAALGLNGNSRLLFFGSERDTDPALYSQLVGRSSEEVLAQSKVAA